MAESGSSSFLSPVVLKVTNSADVPRARSADSTSRACRNASSEDLVPIRTTPALLDVFFLDGTEHGGDEPVEGRFLRFCFHFNSSVAESSRSLLAHRCRRNLLRKIASYRIDK